MFWDYYFCCEDRVNNKKVQGIDEEPYCLLRVKDVCLVFDIPSEKSKIVRHHNDIPLASV